MHPVNTNRPSPVHVALENDDGQGTHSIAGQRRSVLGEVHHAENRAIQQVPSEAPRIHPDNNLLRTEIQSLVQANEKLCAKLGINVPAHAAAQSGPSDAANAQLRSQENEGLSTQHNKLAVENFVLRQMVVADAQVSNLFETLADQASAMSDVQSEVEAFFTILDGLNGQIDADVESIAAVYNGRLQFHLGNMTPKELSVLETNAGAYLKEPSLKAADRAVVQNLLVCVGRAAERMIQRGATNPG